MTDLDAISARHVPLADEPDLPMFCAYCETSSHEVAWPCDTAIVLAALDAEKVNSKRLWQAWVDVQPAIEREARLVAAAQVVADLSNDYDLNIIGEEAMSGLRAALATTPEGES